MQRLGPLVSRAFLALGDSLETQAYHNPGVITSEQRERARLGLQVENWDRALWEFTRASQETDLPARLGEIRVPVLVITGDGDRIVPADQSMRLAEELMDAELVVLPNCGHVAQEECEEGMLAAVETWLANRGLD